GPFDVVELLAADAAPGRLGPFADGPKECVAADDPEHVEATQGIDGLDAFGGGRRGRHGGSLCGGMRPMVRETGGRDTSPRPRFGLVVPRRANMLAGCRHFLFPPTSST